MKLLCVKHEFLFFVINDHIRKSTRTNLSLWNAHIEFSISFYVHIFRILLYKIQYFLIIYFFIDVGSYIVQRCLLQGNGCYLIFLSVMQSDQYVCFCFQLQQNLTSCMVTHSQNVLMAIESNLSSFIFSLDLCICTMIIQ